jgi:hypothetical protein
MAFSGFTGSDLPALLDDFNRANNASLGSNWDEAIGGGAFGLWEIESNQAKAGGSLGWGDLALWDPTSFTVPGLAFDIVDIGGDFSIAPLFDSASASPYILYLVAGPAVDLYLGATDVGGFSLSASFVDGDQIGVRADDTGSAVTFTVYRRAGGSGSWSSLGSGSPSTYAAGPYRLGIGSYGDSAARVDNFRGEEITAPSGGTPADDVPRFIRGRGAA